MRWVVGLALAVLGNAAASAREISWDELYAAGETLYQQHAYLEAASVAEAALRMADATFGTTDLKTAQTLVLLGNAHLGRRQLSRTLHYYQRALAILEYRLGPTHPQVSDVLLLLARYHLLAGSPKQAEALCERALMIRAGALGARHPQTAKTLAVLAECYVGQQAWQRAIDTYDRALAIAAAAHPADEEEVGWMRRRIATLAAAQEQATPLISHPPLLLQRLDAPAISAPAAAEPAPTIDAPASSGASANPAALGAPRGSLPLARGSGESTPLGAMATSFEERAVAMLQIGNASEARNLFRQAVEICEKRLGPTHPETLATLERYRRFLQHAGRPSETEALSTAPPHSIADQ
ncbi:MAG: tetratricopeptide repeat protein [Candidatus Omnitrophica bacterium]|nr:tetratricopeptide repeat protein [Candidatus Omnitrophota bacterium]